MQVDTEPSVKCLDRRKFIRVPTKNAVTYVLVSRSVSKIGVGTGTVLNVSQNGLLLQTDHPIESKYIYLVTTALDNRRVPIIGKTVFSMKAADGLYQTGINLKGDHKDNVEFRKELIRTYHQENVIGNLKKPSHG